MPFRNVGLCLFTLIVLASHADAMERFDIVTTQELVTYLEQRDRKELDFILINTLDELISNHHTIPGSVNIPWSRAEELADLTAGTHMDRLIITYCMGYR